MSSLVHVIYVMWHTLICRMRSPESATSCAHSSASNRWTAKSMSTYIIQYEHMCYVCDIYTIMRKSALGSPFKWNPIPSTDFKFFRIQFSVSAPKKSNSMQYTYNDRFEMTRRQAVLFGELFLISGTFSLLNFLKVPHNKIRTTRRYSADLIDGEHRARNLAGSTESTLDPPLKL